MDAKVYRELREIAGYIESMRHEIGALQVNDLKNTRIPAAGEELGAIVRATEEATHTFMECAEAVMAPMPATRRLQGAGRREDAGDLRGLLVPGHHRPAHRQGGRDLQHIEERVRASPMSMQAKDIDGFLTDSERARDERKQKLLLERPAARRRGRRPERRRRDVQ
jgi:chemotaxis protein CheZ